MANVNPSVYQQDPASYCQSVVDYEVAVAIPNFLNNTPPCFSDYMFYQDLKKRGESQDRRFEYVKEAAQSCITEYPFILYFDFD